MPKRYSVKFQQILAWLMTEVMFGKAHYEIVRGLGRRDPTASAAFRTAPRFFSLTVGAHADAAQMTVARIYDRTSAASIHKLFSAALQEAETFTYASPKDVQKAVQESQDAIRTIEQALKAIRTRRNQTMAHLDSRPFADPAGYVKGGMVSYRQLDELFKTTSRILNRFSLLHRGAEFPLVLKDCTDYERVINILAKSK